MSSWNAERVGPRLARQKDTIHFSQGQPHLSDSKAKHISLQLNSELVSVEVAERTAERFALDAGFGEETASQIGMVTREAVANAIIHGNNYNPNKHVRVDFGITDEELSIQIADQGFGFDPARIPDPLASENILRTSGRGVFLMRAIMDVVSFSELGLGTEITLIKFRNQRTMLK